MRNYRNSEGIPFIDQLGEPQMSYEDVQLPRQGQSFAPILFHHAQDNRPMSSELDFTMDSDETVYNDENEYGPLPLSPPNTAQISQFGYTSQQVRH
jgi:hypothetical protein